MHSEAEKITIKVKDIEIGSNEFFALIGGPCSIESPMQADEVGAFLKEQGVKIMRGGAFKPRTSPFSFQGLGEEGLKILAGACEKYGIVSISEVMDSGELDTVAAYADIIQVGARSMHNYSLLKKIGRVKKPVMLKRGFMSTVEEFLLAAEYMRQNGVKVFLCERGIRTFETYTRNTMDISCVALVHKLSPYPIIVDISHALGRTDIMIPMAKSVVASGSDGLMIEVHPDPQKALSDGKQSLNFDEFECLFSQIKPWIEFRIKEQKKLENIKIQK